MDVSEDPFQDPVLPSQAYQPEQSAPSDTPHISTSHGVLSGSNNASQSSGQEISNIQQPSDVTSRSQTGTDAILSVRPTYVPLHGATQNDTGGAEGPQSPNSSLALSRLVTRRDAGEPADRSPDIIKKGKRKIYTTKWIFIIAFLTVK